MGLLVGGMYYYQLDYRPGLSDLIDGSEPEPEISRCQEVIPEIVSMSHDMSLDPDAVRVLSVETFEEVIGRPGGFRCLGIAVTTEGLSWVVYDQTTTYDGTTYFGYTLSDSKPE